MPRPPRSPLPLVASKSLGQTLSYFQIAHSASLAGSGEKGLSNKPTADTKRRRFWWSQLFFAYLSFLRLFKRQERGKEKSLSRKVPSQSLRPFIALEEEEGKERSLEWKREN